MAHGQGRMGSVLGLLAALLLALAGLLGMVIGGPIARAAPTLLPSVVYTACPAFTTLQTDVNGVGSGQSQTFIFAPGLDCDYNVADPGAPNYVNGQINVASGANVTIDGNGLTIAGGIGGGSMAGGFPLIAVFTPAHALTSLTLDRTTLEFGAAGIQDVYGGAATIVATDSTIRANEIGILAHGAIGASIAATGSLIDGNVDGGIRAEDTQNTNVTVTNSTISGNADGIDAFRADYPSISVTSSNISQNDEGVGIDAFEAQSPGIWVTGSTISYNISGIDVYDAPNTSVTVADSTISNNDDAGVDAAQDSSPTVSVVSSTIASNFYGILADPGTAAGITVSATILADAGNRNCGAPVTDGGYNLSTDTYCGFTSGTSQQGATVAAGLNLQPLADNGGPSPSRALGTNPKSIAIDAIPVDSQGQCVVGEQVDQRGVLRPQGAGCDIGAFEVEYPLDGLPGNASTVHQGYFALLRFYPVDAQGVDYAYRSLPATSVKLIGNGQTIPFVHPFQFGRFGQQPGYQLGINTRDLAPGSWAMEVKIGSGSGASYGWITFAVE